MRIEIYLDAKKEWRWRFVAANNEIVANSEGYTRKWSAKRTAKKLFPNVEIIVVGEQ